MTSDDEKTTPSSEFTGKKPKSGKRTPVEPQHNKNKEVTKKKHKKKALAQEDAISSHEPETIEMVPKKAKKKKVLAKDTSSCDYKGNDLVKKKKKNVLDENIASCDAQTNDVPKKKKKKNISDEDIASLDCKSIDVPKKKKKKNVLDEDNTLYDTKTNVVPKKKKKKNVLEEDNNTSCDTKTNYVSKMKKKKKVLDNEIVPCDPLTNDYVPKKKKKNDLHEDIVSCDLNKNDDRPKKKKKKKVFDEEIELCDPKASVHLRKKKKKPVLEEDDPLRLLKCKSETVGENSEASSVPKSKIVNKKKNSQPDEGDSGDETIENGNAVTEDSKVKKRKKGRYDTVLIKDARSSAKMSSPEVSEIVQLKKRGKASPLNLEDADLDKHSVHLSGLSKNSGKDVLCPRKIDGDNSEQKKKRKTASPDEHLVSSNVRKTRDGECNEDRNGNCGGENTDVVLKKKIKKGKEKSVNGASHKGMNKEMSKKKKRKMVEKLKNTAEEHSTNEDTSDVPVKKKKKVKTEQKTLSTEKDSINHTNPDVQLVLVKAGNEDELHIDTVRRKSLQEDIDRESGNTKSSAFGQWATASFQSSDQQTKFFRLLGGFKKGNQTTPPPTSSQEKANMALGKEGAQTLERNLLEEFDKALAWKQNRGIGLGCQPAQKKIFYIDKTKSKSVKFED